VIHTSTSEVYGTDYFVHITEENHLQGQSHYSASKIGADQIAMSFYTSFETPLAIVRPFNTYGPRQSARVVIPTVIVQIASGNQTIKLGSTHPTRDFSYIKDIVRGFIAVAKSDRSVGEVINIGSNFEISVGDTVRAIAEIMGAEIRTETEEQRIRPKNSEVERLWADNGKAGELTGWRPEYAGMDGFKKGLRHTVKWFTDPENLGYYKPDRYNL